MEKTICFVVGLPGSGKTGYLEQLQKSGFFAINDPTDFDKDVLPYLNDQEQVIAIADTSLCFSANREKMVVKIRSVIPDAVFRWIYFENNPIQCLSNLRAAGSRVGEDLETFVWQLSQGYSIPANIETKPVAQIDPKTNHWPSYTPAETSNKTYKLVRVLDDLVIYSASDWENFRSMVLYILQRYPTHRFMVVDEVINRCVKEIDYDRLIN